MRLFGETNPSESFLAKRASLVGRLCADDQLER